MTEVCANIIPWPNVVCILAVLALAALLLWRLPAIIRAVEGEA